MNGKRTHARAQVYTYSRAHCLQWAETHDTCPLCKAQFGRNAIIHQDAEGKQQCISLPPLCRDNMQQEDDEEDSDDGQCSLCEMRGYLIICDGCNQDFCLECSELGSSMNVPQGQWFCRRCNRRRVSSTSAAAASSQGAAGGELVRGEGRAAGSRPRADRRERARDRRRENAVQGLMDATMRSINSGGGQDERGAGWRVDRGARRVGTGQERGWGRAAGRGMRARFGEEDDEDDEYAGGDGMGRRGRQRGLVGGGGFWRGEGRREAERQRAEAEARQVQDQSASVRREAGETDEARLEREFEEADRARQLLGMGIQGSVGRAGGGGGGGALAAQTAPPRPTGDAAPKVMHPIEKMVRWCIRVWSCA